MKIKHLIYLYCFILVTLFTTNIVSGCIDNNSSLSITPVYAEGNWIDYRASSYAGGDGSRSSPYIISSPEELALLSYEVNNRITQSGYFELSEDINLYGKEWTPIGSRESLFYGSFNGKNHTIKNLTITGTTVMNLYGLFGDIEGGEAINLVLSDFILQNPEDDFNACVGALTGASGSSNISNITVNNAIIEFKNVDHVGSIIGYSWSNISRCINKDSWVFGFEAENVGGLVGYTNSSISECFSDNILVKGKKNIGLLAGATNGVIENSFHMGFNNGILDSQAENRGFLVGLTSKDVKNCYYRGLDGTILDSLIGTQTSGSIINVYINPTYIYDLPQDIWGICPYILDNYPYLKWYYWEGQV